MKFLELREGDDRVETALYLAAREAQQRGVSEDVVPARQFGLEARPEGSSIAATCPRTTIWPEVGCRMPAMPLEHGRLAGSRSVR